jgi:hypothetical protein
MGWWVSSLLDVWGAEAYEVRGAHGCRSAVACRAEEVFAQLVVSSVVYRIYQLHDGVSGADSALARFANQRADPPQVQTSVEGELRPGLAPIHVMLNTQGTTILR